MTEKTGKSEQTEQTPKKMVYSPGSVPTKSTYDVGSDVGETITLRLPECFVMMSEDSINPKNGEDRAGSIGLKTSNGWLWLSYMSAKKLIDKMIENKDQFNSQLKKERERIAVNDLQ